jgi:cytochrome c peroxidase
MHDGRLLTIESVLDHYINNVKNTPNLDLLLQQNNKPGIELSGEDKQNLLAFLKTLDDRSFLTDKNIV